MKRQVGVWEMSTPSRDILCSLGVREWHQWTPETKTKMMMKGLLISLSLSHTQYQRSDLLLAHVDVGCEAGELLAHLVVMTLLQVGA